MYVDNNNYSEEKNYNGGHEETDFVDNFGDDYVDDDIDADIGNDVEDDVVDDVDDDGDDNIQYPAAPCLAHNGMCGR